MNSMHDDRQPPGPGPLTSLRYLANFRTGNMRHYEALFARYGDVVRLRAPGAEDFVMAFHPDDIGHVLRANSKNYPKGARYHELVPVLGWGLVNLFHRAVGRIAASDRPRHADHRPFRRGVMPVLR